MIFARDYCLCCKTPRLDRWAIAGTWVAAYFAREVTVYLLEHVGLREHVGNVHKLAF